jgi:hypothetical protein
MTPINREATTTLSRMFVAFALSAGSAGAAERNRQSAEPFLIAQAATSPSVEKIRAQSQRMKEYRALLADPDSNVRLAALDEMLKSGDAALRELAFEAGFASADQNMRALTLRDRIFSMKTFVLDLQNTAKLAEEAWQKLSSHFRPGLTFHVDKVDAQTGNLELILPGFSQRCVGRIAGQELSVSCQFGAILRLRLTDGAVMVGSYSLRNQASAVSLTVH